MASGSEPSCKDHPTELAKFLCQTCNDVVCRNCVVREGHRNHKYMSIQNASAKEREAIQQGLEDAKQKLSGLQRSILLVSEVKKQVEVRALESGREVDHLIDENIAALERKRAQLKRDIAVLRDEKVQQLLNQEKTMSLAFEEIHNKVECTEHALCQMSDLELLTSRSKLSGLPDFKEVALQGEPCRTSNFGIDVNKSLVVDLIVDKMACVRDEDGQQHDQYVLSMLGGKNGQMFSSRCHQNAYFIVSVKDSQGRNCKVGVNQVKVNIKPPGDGELQNAIMGSKAEHHTFSYHPSVMGTHTIHVYVAGHCITNEPVKWKVESSFYILDSTCATLPPEVYDQDKESLTGYWFKRGCHSWQVRILTPDKLKRSSDHHVFEVGVTDGHRTWRWSNGMKYYPNSSAIVSTISNWQCGDLFLFYLDLDSKQLVIYNQRSHEMDHWGGIHSPIRPYINPQSTDFFGLN